jgi:hypothetical protein
MFDIFVSKTGRVLFSILPVLFFFVSSCSTTDSTLERAIAIRALQAAAKAGAPLSPCASQNYYEAERQIKLGERWLMDRKVMDSSDLYFKKATVFAEQAEEEALFCGK